MGTFEDDSFHQKTALFLEWLSPLKGVFLSTKIEIADFRDRKAGRGIVATADIEENELLFSIDHSDILTVSNSTLWQCIIIPPASSTSLDLDKLKKDPWTALILTLIYEASLGHASKWAPYLDVLPTEFDTLMYWSSAELAQLQGSFVLRKIGMDDADEMFRRVVIPFLKEYKDVFGGHVGGFAGEVNVDVEKNLLSVAHRMASLIMAYAFDLVGSESESNAATERASDYDFEAFGDMPKAMIPVADIFNADGVMHNAHLLQSGTAMTMRASKSIRKGQEIFNDYGQRPRSDLLRRYGYITDNAKIWDVVEPDAEVVIRTACKHNNLNEGEMERRLKLIDAWQVYEDGYDLRLPKADEGFTYDLALLLVIRACLMDQVTFMKEKKVRKVPEEATIDMDTALVLRQIIFQRRQLYDTSIAEDVALLKSDSIEGRARMAVDVRLGEKEILAAALDLVDKLIANHKPEFLMPLSSGDYTTEVSTVKRRKM